MSDGGWQLFSGDWELPSAPPRDLGCYSSPGSRRRFWQLVSGDWELPSALPRDLGCYSSQGSRRREEAVLATGNWLLGTPFGPAS